PPRPPGGTPARRGSGSRPAASGWQRTSGFRGSASEREVQPFLAWVGLHSLARAGARDRCRARMHDLPRTAPVLGLSPMTPRPFLVLLVLTFAAPRAEAAWSMHAG